jgi:hypothetical protein
LKEAVSLLLECYREEADSKFALAKNAIKEDLFLQVA